MFVDKQICCQESLTEWLGNGGPKGDLARFFFDGVETFEC